MIAIIADGTCANNSNGDDSDGVDHGADDDDDNDVDAEMTTMATIMIKLMSWQ